MHTRLKCCNPGGREGTKQSFIRGGQAPRSNPLPRFRTEKVVSLVYLLLTNGTPFTYLELCIPFNCSKCTVSLSVNRRTHTQIYAPTVVEGGGGLMEPLPITFDVLRYFETILPSVEKL